MAKLIGTNGMSQVEAYQATNKKRVSKSVASSSASEICRRPLVKIRIAWLRKQAEKGIETPISAPVAEEPLRISTEKPGKTLSVAEAQAITQDEIAKIITDTLRNRPSAAEVGTLTSALLKIRPQLAQDEAKTRPDPAHLVSYLASFAGMTGKQILAEIGGPRLLITRLCDILSISAVELRDMAQSVVDQR